jgi:large subunit ribosomal protein L40
MRKIAPVSMQEQERRATLNKKWAAYRNQENLKDFKTLDRLVHAQAKALQELRFESEELYQQAIQPDMGMIPFTATGPSNTPPVKDYQFIDGDYNDITKKYDGESK